MAAGGVPDVLDREAFANLDEGQALPFVDLEDALKRFEPMTS